MSIALLSNPPYNMKWSTPPFAQLQGRFCECEIPPESNANYAFILTALSWIDDKAVFLLPCGVLTTDNKQEKAIRRFLVKKNLIEAVITCPDKMFESTSIPTCIIVFNKNKQTTHVSFVDMRQTYETEQREQNGQYGGASHENRTYKKDVKVFSEEQMQKAIKSICEQTQIPGFSKTVSAQTIEENDFILTPGRYIELEQKEFEHRKYSDIIADINRVIDEKNGVKLTMNETLAKTLGLSDIFMMFKQSEELNASMNETIAFTGEKIKKEDFISMSKKAGEFKFENGWKDVVSTILISILQMWKQHIMYLNSEENRYLTELRDALLPDLMSGKIEMQAENKSAAGKEKYAGSI